MHCMHSLHSLMEVRHRMVSGKGYIEQVNA